MKLNLKKLSIGTGICGGITTFFAWIGAIAGFVCFLTFGILALTTYPLDHQNLIVGVVLVVLACVGIGSFSGCIGGTIVGGIIGTQIACLCGDDMC